MMQQRVTQRLCDYILSARNGADRVIIALAGPPGVGKSTLSDQLAAELNARTGMDMAAVLSMDGFHLDNQTLREMQLLHRKGAPETFDLLGFKQLLHQVRRDCGAVRYPDFDRAKDKVLADAKTLEANTRFVIVEGNYLLLQQDGWAALAELFDVTIMLRADPAHLRKRLVARWVDHGLTVAQAEVRADSNDIINARLVLEHSAKPQVSLVTLADDQIKFEAPSNGSVRAG